MSNNCSGSPLLTWRVHFSSDPSARAMFNLLTARARGALLLLAVLLFTVFPGSRNASAVDTGWKQPATGTFDWFAAANWTNGTPAGIGSGTNVFITTNLTGNITVLMR